MPVQSEVHRTNKRAEVWAFFLALAHLVGPAEIYSDKRGAVQALKKDRGRIVLWPNTRMLISLSKSGINTDERVQRELSLQVVWVKAHNRAKEKASMSEEMRQVVIADGKTGELAESGAETHGCDFR